MLLCSDTMNILHSLHMLHLIKSNQSLSFLMLCKYTLHTHTKCNCPGGGIGTSVSLAENSFTLRSMSDKRHVLSWINRLTKEQKQKDSNTTNNKCKQLTVITHLWFGKIDACRFNPLPLTMTGSL